MSYGYTPACFDRGQADFARLDVWLREGVLDEVERLLKSVPAPTVAQRLEPPVRDVHHFIVRRDGVQHHLFLTTVSNVIAR